MNTSQAQAIPTPITYTVVWSPALPALRHKVTSTTVNAYSASAASRAVANDYPAPIHVYSVTGERSA